MSKSIETARLVAEIEAELDRLDSHDNGQGVVCAAEDNLPLGWVRVYDGTGNAYGPAEEILAALKAVEYDSAAIVRVEAHPIQVSETECEVEEEEITARADNRGFEAAWDALSEFAESAPTSSRDWPDELIATEQIEDGDCNDQPNTLVTIQTNAGPKFACGPHGVFNCALSDAFDNGAVYDSREQAVESCD